jgi:hypothetical protein
MSKDTGGFAFPTHFDGKQAADHGMTVRDYFAAKAMQGLIASNDAGAGDRISDIPAYAYLIADAMLAERSK